MKLLNNWRLVLLLCLTLGLAPFFPEPHIWGKLRWMLGDPSSMGTADWMDALMHGIPWILAIRLAVVKLHGLRFK